MIRTVDLAAHATSERDDSATRFLRQCARIELDREECARLVEAASSVRDWHATILSAEDHGLVPLVWHHARAYGIPVPEPERKRLGGLVIRHRDISRVQTEVLCEIVEALDRAGIEHLVLKGAALAHLIYPSPELRPMRDLDLLVAPHDARQAQTLLRDLGFDAPLDARHRVQRFHHHLPLATCRRAGLQINVEIHRDALSGDQFGTLALPSLAERPREVVVERRRLRTFGHLDMLRHLRSHTFEPATRTRLIAVADLVGYAARYRDEIDWEAMARRDPTVVNALTLLHYVTPLPASLGHFRPPARTTPPPGVGQGIAPLAAAAGRADARSLVGELLYPSEWWMRAYYGVPLHRSLAPVRWGRHLGRLVWWGVRRAFSLLLGGAA